MARPETLEIRFGPARWLLAASLITALLGLLAIVLSPAGWAWKSGTSALLIVVTLLAHVQTNRTRQSGVMRLYSDSVLHYLSIDGKRGLASLEGNNWTSRWFSVLSLLEEQGGSRRFYIVCSSQNPPDEYRRLLRFLRMRTAAPDTHRISW